MAFLRLVAFSFWSMVFSVVMVVSMLGLLNMCRLKESLIAIDNTNLGPLPPEKNERKPDRHENRYVKTEISHLSVVTRELTKAFFVQFGEVMRVGKPDLLAYFGHRAEISALQ
jgi:hypothetical protein